MSEEVRPDTSAGVDSVAARQPETAGAHAAGSGSDQGSNVPTDREDELLGDAQAPDSAEDSVAVISRDMSQASVSDSPVQPLCTVLFPITTVTTTVSMATMGPTTSVVSSVGVPGSPYGSGALPAIRIPRGVSVATVQAIIDQQVSSPSQRGDSWAELMEVGQEGDVEPVPMDFGSIVVPPTPAPHSGGKKKKTPSKKSPAAAAGAPEPESSKPSAEAKDPVPVSQPSESEPEGRKQKRRKKKKKQPVSSETVATSDSEDEGAAVWGFQSGSKRPQKSKNVRRTTTEEHVARACKRYSCLEDCKGKSGLTFPPRRDADGYSDDEAWLLPRDSDKPPPIEFYVGQVKGALSSSGTEYSREDKIRLGWIWHSFKVGDVCPSAQCQAPYAPKFPTQARFARHLVEVHLCEVPNFYCSSKGRSSRTCNGTFRANRRGDVVRHLQSSSEGHSLGGETAIKRMWDLFEFRSCESTKTKFEMKKHPHPRGLTLSDQDWRAANDWHRSLQPSSFQKTRKRAHSKPRASDQSKDKARKRAPNGSDSDSHPKDPGFDATPAAAKSDPTPSQVKASDEQSYARKAQEFAAKHPPKEKQAKGPPAPSVPAAPPAAAAPAASASVPPAQDPRAQAVSAHEMALARIERKLVRGELTFLQAQDHYRHELEKSLKQSNTVAFLNARGYFHQKYPDRVPKEPTADTGAIPKVKVPKPPPKEKARTENLAPAPAAEAGPSAGPALSDDQIRVETSFATLKEGWISDFRQVLGSSRERYERQVTEELSRMTTQMQVYCLGSFDAMAKDLLARFDQSGKVVVAEATAKLNAERRRSNSYLRQRDIELTKLQNERRDWEVKFRNAFRIELSQWDGRMESAVPLITQMGPAPLALVPEAVPAPAPEEMETEEPSLIPSTFKAA